MKNNIETGSASKRKIFFVLRMRMLYTSTRAIRLQLVRKWKFGACSAGRRQCGRQRCSSNKGTGKLDTKWEKMPKTPFTDYVLHHYWKESTLHHQYINFTKALIIWLVSHSVFNLEYCRQTKDISLFFQEFLFALPCAQSLLNSKSSIYLTITSDSRIYV